MSNPTQWAGLTTGAWCYFNNDPANGTVYGKLYNWYAVNDPRGLAPFGWHIPSNSEWISLSDCLGGFSLAGGKIKETGTVHWLSPNTDANNASGWTGLPGGGRNNSGPFGDLGFAGIWWSSTEFNAVNAWHYNVDYNNGRINMDETIKSDGFSIRCVKD